MNPSVYPLDLHMHTTVSDGTDTPEELLENVRKAGLRLFSVTDHDAVRAGVTLKNNLRDNDPRFLTGVEFSCKDEEGKYHILGYAFDPDAASMTKCIETGHGYRIEKIHARLEGLRKQFGIVFPEEDTEWLYGLENPGKPHIANLLLRYGYAKTKEEAIDGIIDRIDLRSLFLRPKEAIRGILESGGVPVLAHPSFGSGEQLVTGDAMDKRLRKLIGFGLEGVEAFYATFTRELQDEMLGFAERYGLYVTAGSDYHGRNKPARIGETHLPAIGEIPEGMRRFLERVL